MIANAGRDIPPDVETLMTWTDVTLTIKSLIKTLWPLEDEEFGELLNIEGMNSVLNALYQQLITQEAQL